MIAGSVGQALAILETTLAQKARQYRAAGRLNLFAIDCYSEFYRRMTTRHHPSGLVHVAALVLDEQALATHWGCVHNGRFVYLMPSYDAAWGKLSPGRLLLDHLIEWSFCQGLREFDFTIGDEPYKATFCNVSDGLYRRIAARSPLGWAYWLKATWPTPIQELRGLVLPSRRPLMRRGRDTNAGPPSRPRLKTYLEMQRRF